MKKLLVVLLALLTVGALFAQVSVSEWGRIGVAPVVTSTESYTISGTGAPATQPNPLTNWYAGTFPTWASDGRVGLTFSGTADDMGFTLNVDSNIGSGVGIGDQAKVWAKFGTIATISLGQIQGDTLRGKIGNDDVSVIGGLGYGPMGGNDAIFQRFYPKSGILFELTPVAGLYAAAALDAKDAFNAPLAQDSNHQSTGLSKVELADTVYDMQAAVGYTIEGIGLARLQYIGLNAGRPIQAAFAYTGLAGLTVDVGVTYPLEESKSVDYSWQNRFATAFGVPGMTFSSFDYQVLSANIGASYAKDALSVTGRVDVYFPGEFTVSKTSTTVAPVTMANTVAESQALSLGVWLDGNYKLSDKLAVGLEGQYQMAGNKTTTTFVVAGYPAPFDTLNGTYVTTQALTKSSFSAFPYAQVTFSKGSLRSGVVIGSSKTAFNGTGTGYDTTATVDALAWGIPVVVTYSF